MVGAVVVRGDAVVAEGYHESFGGPHAEVNALAAAGERAHDSTLYVTLEPCAHHGKTPPCTDAILHARVARVIAATTDPTAAGGGAKILSGAGVDVRLGVEEEAARELNAAFFHAAVSDRPWVILKLAVSIDGGIANRDRAPVWLTGHSARAEVHRMRAGVDAVAVGVGTVLSDDPQLTVRHSAPPRRPPLRVVFDRTARIPVSATLVRTARDVPTMVIAEREDSSSLNRLRASGVEVLSASSIPESLRALRSRGVHSLLVEGGAELASAFVNARCVDRLVVFQAPVLLGGGALNPFAHVKDLELFRRRLRVIERRPFADDLMTVYAVDPF
jgi:diaminohydroxyphosphoribosylaminopyrimidine deaminase/5-amino-6-(5-phosphoribosylamino)uracil reductase